MPILASRMNEALKIHPAVRAGWSERVVWIPRPIPEAIEALDARYYRTRHGEMKWAVTPKDKCPPLASDLDIDLSAQTVYLVGKGASLDAWLRTVNSVRSGRTTIACINETIMLVPRADFCFYLDPFLGREILMPEGTKVVTDPEAIAEMPQKWDAAIYDPQSYEVYRATAPVAIETLARWGARAICFVGFDSYGNDHRTAYAAHVDALQITKPPQSYEYVNREIARLIDKHGIDATFWHEGG